MSENVFERLAQRYDTPERKELAAIITAQVKKKLKDSAGKLLIDYGAGTGLISLELHEKVDSLLLVDSSKEMLAVAQQKIEDRQITNAKTFFADFLQVKSQQKADLLLMSLVLLHIPDTEKILRILFETLKPGGRMILIDFEKNDQIDHPKVHNGFSERELSELLEKVGFQTWTRETFYQGEHLFMNKAASLFCLTADKPLTSAESK